MTEETFVDLLLQRLPPAPADIPVPPGDDCAAIDVGGGRWLLIAVDQLVGDRHFVAAGTEATAPRQAGNKLLARNLSDIAAMGGVPRFCLIAGAFGPRHPPEWMDAFHQGILETARQFGVAVIGGDLAATPADTVAALTIIGEVPAGTAVCRQGARPGDDLWCTGTFGRSLPTGHHLTFTPRCAEGQWLRRETYARAMIDVSDGLVLDLHRLCQASTTGAVLALDDIPPRTATTSIGEMCGDGEDYELLFAVSSERHAELRSEWPFETPLACIGYFSAETGHIRAKGEGRQLPSVGWDHFNRSGEATE